MRSHIRRTLSVGCLWGLAAFSAAAQQGAPPLFPGIPFERWLAEGSHPQIRWTTHVAEPELSIYQRLLARIEMTVDGEELVKRKGHGQMVLFAGIEDGEKHVYRTRQLIDLQKVEDGTGKLNITMTQGVFLMPGDYQISLGVVDAGNGEHSVAQRMLHVAALHPDPLPEAWKDLPPVEFIEDPPGELFLPSLTGRLHLPLEIRRPIDIELLVNTSRSTIGMGPRAGQMTVSSLGQLIPAMKVLSQVAMRDETMKVAVLDLARHKVIFEQKMPPTLDWPTLRGALTEADPNVIDVHSLENRKQDAHFFVTQVDRRIESASADMPHVIIVLSGPMAFASGADLHPIQASGGAKTHIYYIRYHSPVQRLTPAESFERSTRGRRSRFDPLTPSPIGNSNETVDSLASTVKPLHPHLFDIYTPDQFRKALATIMDEVSRM